MDAQSTDLMLPSEAKNSTTLPYIAKGQEEDFGSQRLDMERGQYIASILRANVARDMAIAQDEIAGPVLTVRPFDTFKETVAFANETEHGVAAFVRTKNIAWELPVTQWVEDCSRDKSVRMEIGKCCPWIE